MSAAFAEAVIELDRRYQVMDDLFGPQYEAAHRPLYGRRGTELRAILTPRRAGKSYSVYGPICAEAEQFPGSDFRYVMLTQEQCKDVAWKPLREIDQKYKLGLDFKESDLKVVFPNKSTIHYYGANKKNWMKVMRGQKSRICVVDEAQDFTAGLHELIYNVLRPTLMDERGTLYIAGTPGKWKTDIFYDITATVGGVVTGTGEYHGWKLFNWSTADNPHMAAQYAEEIAQIRAEHPGVDIMTIPRVLREYFGLWAEDDQNSVYAFDLARNSFQGPWIVEEHPEASYIGGIDLGFNDAKALVVGAYEEYNDEWIVVEAHKRSKANLQYIVDLVLKAVHDYPGIRFVGDEANKDLFNELQLRLDMYIEPASKSDKRGWIELYNRDAGQGRVKHVDARSSVLVDEQLNLKWFKRPSGKVEETPGVPNDCCDANLYAYRKAYHYLHQERPEAPQPGSREYYDAVAAQLKQEAIKRIEEKNLSPRQRRWRQRNGK